MSSKRGHYRHKKKRSKGRELPPLACYREFHLEMETLYELLKDNFVRVNSPRSDGNVSSHPSFRRSEVLVRIHRRILRFKLVVVWTIIWVVGVAGINRGSVRITEVRRGSILWIRNEWVPVCTPRTYAFKLNW